MKFTKIITVIMAALMLVLMLAACGNGNKITVTVTVKDEDGKVLVENKEVKLEPGMLYHEALAEAAGEGNYSYAEDEFVLESVTFEDREMAHDFAEEDGTVYAWTIESVTNDNAAADSGVEADAVAPRLGDEAVDGDKIVFVYSKSGATNVTISLFDKDGKALFENYTTEAEKNGEAKSAVDIIKEGCDENNVECTPTSDGKKIDKMAGVSSPTYEIKDEDGFTRQSFEAGKSYKIYIK